MAFPEQCQFNQSDVYRESCSGNSLQARCPEGQRKARPCIGTDRSVLACVSCEDGFYQDKPNNCTECYPCSECPSGYRLSQNCTARRDTECELEVTSTTATTPDDVQRQWKTAPNDRTVNDDPQGDTSHRIAYGLSAVILGVGIILVAIYRKQLVRISKRGCKPRRRIRNYEEQPAEDEEQPAEDEEQPAEDEEQPAEDEEQPAEDEEQPAEDEEQPAEDEEQPAEDEEQQAEDEEGLAEEVVLQIETTL
ncbi:uncharacterized protein [Diadema setosum]|uniref:uncharacterized protein n=1 Tax=Diadema setosum TaxID=31175 RepID=UPI003B3BDD40